MSGYMDVFKMVHSKLRREEMVPLVDKLDLMKNSVRAQFKDFVAVTGAKEECFIYIEDGMPPFAYYDFPYYHALHSFDTSGEERFSPVNFYKVRNERIDKALAEKDYGQYLMMVEGHCDMLVLQDLFNSLEGGDKYALLKEKYTEIEYGHDLITREMWHEAISLRSTDDVNEVPVDGDVVTIYRGNSSESTPVDKAMSWTIDFNKAIFFASRATGQSSLYKAKIKKSEVIDYFEDRGESEVLCFPENVFDIEMTKQEETDDLMKHLIKGRYVDEYSYYRNTLIDNEDMPILPPLEEKSHDKLHTQRVLMLALTLSRFEDLSHTERAILANVAVFHDIGRTHDYEDAKHGFKSVEKMDRYSLMPIGIRCVKTNEKYRIRHFAQEELMIIRFIIQYHCIDDSVAFYELSKLELTNKDRQTAKKLYKIFKDADALDRVRLGDLNADYLRREKSKELIVFAVDLMKNLK